MILIALYTLSSTVSSSSYTLSPYLGIGISIILFLFGIYVFYIGYRQ